jgi:hypothetical protein
MVFPLKPSFSHGFRGFWGFPMVLPVVGGSNDKPDMTFSNPMLDDGSLKRVMQAIAPALQRSFVIPELKSSWKET